MKKLGITLLMLFFAAGLSGCASDLALKKGQNQVDTSANSIVLLPVTISNQNNPGCQPALLYAFLSGAESKRFNASDGLFKEEKDSYKQYLLSFSLPPGTYTLDQINGRYFSFLLHANCNLRLDAKFDVKPNSIMYLGHLRATIVERKNDEERAGILIPLIDQAVAGFSTGTFVIDIADRYDEDIANYRAEFPGLKSATIEKALLPVRSTPAAAAPAKQ